MYDGQVKHHLHCPLSGVNAFGGDHPCFHCVFCCLLRLLSGARFCAAAMQFGFNVNFVHIVSSPLQSIWLLSFCFCQATSEYTAVLLAYSTRADNGHLHYILWCCRDHTLHTLHEVYEKRRALNLEAITLMVPQVTLTVTACTPTPASDSFSVTSLPPGKTVEVHPWVLLCFCTASLVDCIMHSVCSVALSALLSVTKNTTAAQHCADRQACGVQGRSDVHGKDGLQQHFADMAFFSRARTTGKMGEVVDKLKANLRYAIYLTWIMLQGRPCHVAWQVAMQKGCHVAIQDAFCRACRCHVIMQSSCSTGAVYCCIFHLFINVRNDCRPGFQSDWLAKPD